MAENHERKRLARVSCWSCEEHMGTIRSACIECLVSELEASCMRKNEDGAAAYEWGHAERARADKAAAHLQRLGYRFCDIPACNCGDWHAPTTDRTTAEPAERK